MVKLKTRKANFPPLLHLSYVLQHLSDDLLLREVGIGLSAARIMSVLSMSAASSQRLIAAELRQTEANVSRQLQAMKKQGLVSITHNKKRQATAGRIINCKRQFQISSCREAFKKAAKTIFEITKQRRSRSFRIRSI